MAFRPFQWLYTCGQRFREIIIPDPTSKEWANKTSDQFRKYFTTIAEAKSAFIAAVQQDRFEHVANVAAVLPVEPAEGAVE